jgi:hypothetical protein
MRVRAFFVMATMCLGGPLAIYACGPSNPQPTTPGPEGEGSTASSTDKKLDCAFVKNPENCWRTFTAKLGACLGGKPAGPGKFEPDGSLCILPEDLMVKLGQSCDPDGKCEVTDVFMGKSQKKCMEFHVSVSKPSSELGRGEGTFNIAAPHGTVTFKYDEKQKSITCPDGTVYSGTGDWKKELSECDSEGSYDGIPSYAFVKNATQMDGKKKKKAGSLTFELSSMDVLFECAKP